MNATRRRAAVLAVALALVIGVTTVVVGAVRPAAADTSCVIAACPPGISHVVDAVGAIPGVGAVGDVVGSVVGAAANMAATAATGVLNVVGRGIADALGDLFAEVSAFLSASSSPQVTLASFVSGDGAYHQVAQLAALLVVLFVLLGVIQGVLAGDALAMIGRTLRNVPLAVLAIAGFPWLVDQLVGLVDAVCASLLPSGATLGTLARVFALDTLRFNLAAVAMLSVVFLACAAIYAELVVRAALVTIVVAMAPLSFAAMVWPAARGAARKAVELVVALVLSKLAIWIALAVGMSLFEAHAGELRPGGAAWGQMISGAAVLGVAVFAPFVVWKLMPVAEAAMVGQGVSRMPGRAAMGAVMAANMFRGRGGGSSSSGGGEHPSLGADLPARSLEATSRTDGSGAQAAGGAASSSGPAAASIGAAGGAAGAAPAAAVGKAAEHVSTHADAATSPPTPRREWGFRPDGDTQ